MSSAYSVGRQFLRLVIDSRDVGSIDRNKIQESMISPEEAAALRFIKSYHGNRRTYGMVPTLDEIDERFPSLGLGLVVSSTEDIDQIAHIIRERHLGAQLDLLSMQISRMSREQNPYGALDLIVNAAQTYSVTHNPESDDLILTECADDLLTELTIVSESGNLVGSPWAWERLNEVTGGKSSGTLNLIYGRPKSGKTHLKIYDAIHTYMAGYNILWVNIEMSPKQQMRRALAAAMEVDYEVFSKAPTDEMIEEARELLSQLTAQEGMQRELLSGRMTHQRFRITTVRTLSELHAKVLEVQPDVVYIDTANELMTDKPRQRENERQQAIVRTLRDMTRQKELGYPCLVCSVHANREGAKEFAKNFSEIGGSDQWARSCDLLLRNIRLRDPETGGWMQALLPPGAGGREIVWDGMLVHFAPYFSMDYVRDTNREEVMSMVEVNERQKKEAAEQILQSNAPPNQQPRSPRRTINRVQAPLNAGWASGVSRGANGIVDE